MEIRLDLTTCDSEPIHIPGAIQSHGFLIALDSQAARITHVSANVETWLGIAHATLFGQGFERLLGEHIDGAWDFNSLSQVQDGLPAYQATCQLKGSPTAYWDAIAHRYDSRGFVEFEPARRLEAKRVNELYRNLQDALVNLEHASSIQEMAAIATKRVRQICGFDRMMLYRFDKDWNGEVISEDKRDDLEPFLGLNYPASDIPSQDRALSTKNWLRFITDCSYTATPTSCRARNRRSPTRHELFSASKRLANTHRIPQKHGRPCLNVDLAFASSKAVGTAVNLGHNRLYQIIWFRPERICTVNWAGDPHKIADAAEIAERLSPRGSFALWRKIVKGRSDEWSADEIAAGNEFRQNVVRLMLRRAEMLAVANDDLRLANIEREKSLESERHARIQSDRLNRLKDEFVATLSHELRTPLNAIFGWTQLLQMSDTNSAEELQEGLEVIERNARSQATMIEDLLEISRIVSGRLTLDLQDINLAEIVDNTLESLSVAAAGKSIRVEKMIGPLDSIKATGDPNRLRQVVWNLLSNAIKFTPKVGRIQIVLDKVDSHVELTVADTGIGPEKEFLPYIFERYRQADPSITRQYGGLGLGLAIVRNLVELYGGNIAVHSPDKNQGSTFTVSLPIRIVSQSELEHSRERPHANRSTPTSKFDLSGVHVLVIDDEDDARDLISRVLRAAGCEGHVCRECGNRARPRRANNVRTVGL